MSNLPSCAGIYEITHMASGRRYVGSAKNMRLRVYRHFYDLRAGKHHCVFLQRLFAKHGAGAFVAQAVRLSPGSACLIFQEQIYIDVTDAQGLLLNTCKVAGRCDGLKQSEATKAKRAASLRKWVRPADYGERISLAKRGICTPAMMAATKACGESRRFRLTQGEVAEIVERNRSGVEMAQIYRELGRTHHTVLREIRRHFPEFKALQPKVPTGAKGERHGMARLTSQQVYEIRESSLRHKQIAEKYGISWRHVGDIKRGRAWSK